MQCALYCRLSREDREKEEESESIQNQKSMLTRYAQEKGWDIFRIYCDEDYSGADRDRPAFQDLLRDAQEKKFQLVLCKSQSRFTRDMELVEKYLHTLFPLWGVHFVSLVDNGDTRVKGNKKARQINGLVNEWYLEDLSENLRAVLDEKRLRGDYIASFPLYGYRKDPENHNRLLPDPGASPIVERIFNWALEGWGKSRIAQMLNANHIPNPTAYKQQQGYDYKNGKSSAWNPSTVGRILRNEMYTGTLVQGIRQKPSYKSKKVVSLPREEWIRVEGTHPPLIPPDVFQQVQTLLNRRTHGGLSGKPHPLAGLVFCADCSSALVKTSASYQGRRFSYLRCGNYARNRAACTSHSIRLDTLLEVIRERLFLLISPEEIPLRTVQPAIDFSEQVHQIEVQLSQRSQALRKVYVDYGSFILEESQFCALRDSIIQEKERLTRQLRFYRRQQALTEQPSSAAGEERWQSILPAVLRRVELEEGESGKQTLKIYWNL